VNDPNDIVTDLRSVSCFYCAGGLEERAANEIDRLRADLAQRTAELADLKERLVAVEQIIRLAPELNLNNYGHDEVCELNDAMIQLYWIVRENEEQ
jgi:hypothetical protein